MGIKKFGLYIIAIIFITTLVLTGCGGGVETPVQKSASPETIEQIIKDISTKAAYNLIQENKNNPDFIILDVRTDEEFREGHIENALNIDFYAENFSDLVDELEKDKAYLVYCRTGRRSAGAVEIMKELDFREVYNMEGGIVGWEKANYPVVK